MFFFSFMKQTFVSAKLLWVSQCTKREIGTKMINRNVDIKSGTQSNHCVHTIFTAIVKCQSDNYIISKILYMLLTECDVISAYHH
jgi:hypothetical protein